MLMFKCGAKGEENAKQKTTFVTKKNHIFSVANIHMLLWQPANKILNKKKRWVIKTSLPYGL